MADQRRENEQSQGTPEIERRSVLQAGLAFAGGMLADSVARGQIASAAPPSQITNSGAEEIPRRPLGKTGEQVSIIGLGGYHLGGVQSQDLAVHLVQEAIDAITHGNTMTTAVKNGWDLVCRDGAIKLS
jgi:hypothetical protein